MCLHIWPDYLFSCTSVSLPYQHNCAKYTQILRNFLAQVLVHSNIRIFRANIYAKIKQKKSSTKISQENIRKKCEKKWAHNFRTKICANFPKNNKCKISAQKYAQDLVHANVRIFRANIHVQILRKKMSAKFAHIFVRKFCTHFVSNFLRSLFCVVFTKTCAYFSASLLQ